MAEINLLPIDLSSKATTSGTSSSIKRITLILSILFFILVTLGIVLIIFMSNQLNTSITKQDGLKIQIKALEGVEQKLILVKDRLSKIQTAQNEINTQDNLEILSPVIANLPVNTKLDTISVEADGSIAFSIISTDSLSMASFINSLVSSGIYKNLSLSDFTFDQTSGYKVTLTNP